MAKEYIELTDELAIPVYKNEKETGLFDGKFNPWSWGILVEEAKKDLEGE